MIQMPGRNSSGCDSSLSSGDCNSHLAMSVGRVSESFVAGVSVDRRVVVGRTIRIQLTEATRDDGNETSHYKMSLDPYSPYFLPVEVLQIVATLLPLKQRAGLLTLSRAHARMLADMKRMPYMLTIAQQRLVRAVVREMTSRESAAVNLLLPSGSGKTLIALEAAFGGSGFAAGGAPVVVCCPTSMVVVWRAVLSRHWPSLRLSVKLSTSRAAPLTKYQIDAGVVLCNHQWLCALLERLAATKPTSAPYTIIVDNIYAANVHAALTKYAHTTGARIMTLSNLGHTVLDYCSSTIRVGNPIDISDIPRIMRLYSAFVPIPDNSTGHHSLYDVARDAEYLPTAGLAWTTHRYLAQLETGPRALTRAPRKIVFFVETAIMFRRAQPIHLFATHYRGYRLFLYRHGDEFIDYVRRFEQCSDDAIIFVSYKRVMDGHSIRANECVFFEMPNSGNSVHLASRSVVRVSNDAPVVRLRYIAESPAMACLKCAISEYSGMRGVAMTLSLVRNGIYPFLTRLERYNLDINRCPLALALFLYNPEHYMSDSILLRSVPSHYVSDYAAEVDSRRGMKRPRNH